MTGHPLWLRVSWAIHRVADRLSGGRLGARVAGVPALWLTTVGRTSGIERTNALYYLEDGPDLVVVASNVGLDADPAWWLNLQAHPETVARTGRTIHRVRARAATPDERDRLWPRLVRLYPEYASYARKTDRPIPVVILEPRPDG